MDVQEWIGVMAPYLKQLDSNHLVTTGEDGFYSTTTSRQDANPIYEPSESQNPGLILKFIWQPIGSNTAPDLLVSLWLGSFWMHGHMRPDL